MNNENNDKQSNLLRQAKDYILTSIPETQPELVKGFAEAYSLLCAAEWQERYSERELASPLLETAQMQQSQDE